MKTIDILNYSERIIFYASKCDYITAEALARELREEITAEMRREEAKNGGTLNRTKAAERVIKNAKAFQPRRECFAGAWTDSAGRQCICDGVQAYRLREA